MGASHFDCKYMEYLILYPHIFIYFLEIYEMMYTYIMMCILYYIPTILDNMSGYKPLTKCYTQK